MSSLEWFYIQQWKNKQYEHLHKNRLIVVNWETDEEYNLPNPVKLPLQVELTDDAIYNYLSETFGHLASSWQVYIPLEKE